MSTFYDRYGVVKQAAMQQAEDHADKAWLDLMLKLTRVVALTHAEFTTDDIMILYESIHDAPKTHEPRALGPVMKKAAQAGYCRKTNTVAKSVRRSNHNRPLAVWASLICEARP